MFGITQDKKVAQVSEKRAELWREFKRNYEAKLDEGFEAFSQYCEEFRKKWLSAK